MSTSAAVRQAPTAIPEDPDKPGTNANESTEEATYSRSAGTRSSKIPDAMGNPTIVETRTPEDLQSRATALSPPESRFREIAKWEGIVSSRLEDTFEAELHDPAQRKAPLVAEFAMDDVAESDRRLVQPGAVFYWTLGYSKSEAGTVQRTSELYFRRLPARSHIDRRTIEDVVTRLSAVFRTTDD